MDRLGDQLFPGARFTSDQNGRAARRDLRDQVQNTQHPLAFADDIREAVALLQRPLQFAIFAFQAATGDHALDLDQQLVVVPGLREIIVGPAFDGLHRDLNRAIGRDQKDRRLKTARPQLFKDIQARSIGQRQVEQNQIMAARFGLLHALGGIDSHVDFVVV